MADKWTGDVLPDWIRFRYADVRPLGVGARSSVFRVYDRQLDGPVVLKILDRGLSRDSRERNRFRREAEGLTIIVHPHLVMRLDYVERDDVLFYTMEYLSGGTLQTAAKKGGLTPRAAVEAMGQVCDAVTALHDVGVLHRNLELSKVMLSGEGLAKLIDVGTSEQEVRATIAALKKPGNLTAAARNQPPELFSSGWYDKRGDVYQLGVMLYELVTGNHPYEGCTARALLSGSCLEAVPRPSVLAPMVHDALDGLITACISAVPDERPDNPKVLGQWLATVLQGKS